MSLGTIFVATLALLVLFSTTDGAIVGIDFSSGFVKVALVRPGTNFHIVEDETSKRKFPNQIGFSKGERRFGNGAKSLLIKKSKTTFNYINRLLMRKEDSPEVQQYVLDGYPFEFAEIEGRGVIGIKDGEDIYEVDEMLAMIFEYIQRLAKADAPHDAVKDCVLTVPSVYTQLQRQALMDAAELAGWNVLSLINANTAAAVQFGVDLDYNVDESQQVLFYNMGSSSTEVSLVEFSSYLAKSGKKKNQTIGQARVLGVASDDMLGGRDFDSVVLQFLVGEAGKMFPNDDVTQVPRLMAKLRAAATKAKTVLSANTEAVIYVESLWQDKDMRVSLQRSAFEEMSHSLVERSIAPLSSLCEEFEIDPTTIDMVLVGGGARVPAVQASLKQFLGGRDLKMNLDGDEAMAMGAVFRAANMSVTFQTRKFGLIDVHRYPVKVRIFDNAAEGVEETFSKEAPLFSRFNKLAKKKSVALSHSVDFNVEVMHAEPEGLPHGIPQMIAKYTVEGVEALMQDPEYNHLTSEADPRVSLSFLLDSSGLVSVVKAEATLEEMVEVPVVKKKKKKDKKKKKKKKKGEEGEEEQTEGEAEDTTEGEGDAAATDDTTTSEQENESVPDSESGDAAAEGDAAAAESEEGAEGAEDEEEEEEEKEPEPEFEMQKKTHKIPLKVTMLADVDATVRLLNSVEKKAIKKKLKDLAKFDEMKAELAKAKNDLESHVYRTRSAAYEDFEQVATEEMLEELIAALMEAEDWLFDQSNEVTKENIKLHTAKKAELEAMSGPINYRLTELEARPLALEQAHEFIEKTYKLLAKLPEERAWLPEKDIQKLFNMTRDIESDLNEKLERQASLAVHEEPAIDSNKLLRSLHPVAKFTQELLKRKEPPPPVEKDKDKKKKRKRKKKKKGEEDVEEEEGTAPTEEEEAGEEPAATDADADAATDADADADADADSTPEGDATHEHDEL